MAVMKAVVQVPAYREKNLSQTLDAIAEQAVPDGWDVAYEAWVTPSSPCCCYTLTQAARHPVFDAYEAPVGKLSTRNTAHDHALEGGADAIISWDADAPPVTEDTLSRLLTRIEEPGVVAVEPAARSSAPTSPANVVFGTLVDIGAWVEDAVRPHLNGQCHALSTEAWATAGPFDASFDQTDEFAVRQEEEIDFFHRVGEVGAVVTDRGAVVYNDLRRHICNLPGYKLVDDGYCNRRGVETFHPHTYNGRR